MAIPMGLIRACVVMLPRLQAEEALLDANTTALGSGTLKASDAQALTSGLRRGASGKAGRSRPQPATPDILSASGIRVVMVEKA